MRPRLRPAGAVCNDYGKQRLIERAGSISLGIAIKVLQSGKRNLWAGTQQQCFAAGRASASRVCFARYRGIPNASSEVLSAGLRILPQAEAEVVYAMVGPLSEPTQ